MAIGSQLKAYYEHEQAQPVSDRLARLLRKLKSWDDAASVAKAATQTANPPFVAFRANKAPGLFPQYPPCFCWKMSLFPWNRHVCWLAPRW